MTDRFFTRPEAHRRGLSDSGIRSGLRSGQLARVRHGALTDSVDWATLTDADRHRVRVHAAALRLSTPAVVSHASAAAIHRFPVLHPDFGSEHFTLDGSGGGRRGPRTLHRARLDACDVTVVDGVAVTSPARTAIDVACTGSFEQAVCIVESALRAGCTAEQLDDAFTRIGKRKGIAVARRACDFADGATESIGESWSRAIMTRWRDVPEPRLQHRFVDASGRFVGRTDFDWNGVLVGEFDGLAKYEGGPSIVDEKLREDALRALGLHVIRWTWGDLVHPERLRRTLRGGLDRVGL